MNLPNSASSSSKHSSKLIESEVHDRKGAHLERIVGVHCAVALNRPRPVSGIEGCVAQSASLLWLEGSAVVRSANRPEDGGQPFGPACFHIVHHLAVVQDPTLRLHQPIQLIAWFHVKCLVLQREDDSEVRTAGIAELQVVLKTACLPPPSLYPPHGRA